MKFKIKKNDLVKVMAGRDRGKQGKVTQIFPGEAKAVVEGVNLRFKHLRATKTGQAGSRVQFACPLAINKLMVVCSHCNKPCRVQLKNDATGKAIRTCQKCSEVL